MKNARLTLRTATGITVSLLAYPLAACSGGSQALPGIPVSAPAGASAPAPATAVDSASIPDPKGKKSKLLFVSDNENSVITVYNAASKTQNPPPLRTITNGVKTPNGIAVDKSGNLYVTNYSVNTVTVYAPNKSAPKATISNGLNGPWDVKVDGSGNIYVANDPVYGSIAFINEYPAGSSSPSATWYVPTQGMTISGIALLNPNQPAYTSIYALAFTTNGSGFATGYALSCYPGNSTCVSLGAALGQTGGIAIAQSPGGSKPFQWLAVDQYIPGVDIYTQGQPMTQLTTGGTPEFLTLDSTGSKLFVVDRFYGRAVEYSFPAGKQLNTFKGGAQAYGVATYPSGTYH
jgi:hypothetical protein